MSILKNNIGWCDVTMNPGIGCRGCELERNGTCYAMNDTPARVLRAGKWPGYIGQKVETFGPGRTFVPTKEGLAKLRRYNDWRICDRCRCLEHIGSNDCRRCAAATLRNIRCFADSNSDWMDWPTEILAASLDEIRKAPNVTVILLTKWPELWRERIDSVIAEWAHQEAGDGPYSEEGLAREQWAVDWLNGSPPSNVWVLTSVLGNQLDEKRLTNLLKIPAVVHGLSLEPLLGGVDFTGPRLEWLAPFKDTDANLNRTPRIDWVIVGCDSSVKRLGWEFYEVNAAALIEQFQSAGVRTYHKQMPIKGAVSANPAEWPEDLRVQEFPEMSHAKGAEDAKEQT